MHTVYHFKTSLIKINHSHGKKVPGSTLDGGLKDTGTDQVIPAPLPGKSILAVDSNARLLAAPWCGEQLSLWPLPADQAPAR